MEQILKVFEFAPKGVVEGLAVAAILFILKIALNKVKDLVTLNKYGGIIGKYFIYLNSTSGDDTITIAKLDIKNRLGKLIAKAKSEEFSFKGTVAINDLHFYINLKGVNHPEEVFFIFHTPLHKNIHKLWGTFSGISVMREPCVGICIISDTEIEIDKLKEELNSFPIPMKNTLLKIPVDEKIYSQNRQLKDKK